MSAEVFFDEDDLVIRVVGLDSVEMGRCILEELRQSISFWYSMNPVRNGGDVVEPS